MILLIDDEPEYIKNYKIALEDERFQTELITNVDEALSFIHTRGRDIEAIILDIMMPYGDSFSGEETHGGTRTGTRFYGKIREVLPDTPIFILTNVSDENIEEQFSNDKNCSFHPKGKPFAFAEIIRNRLRGTK
jgi:CheY-like chemotaxis protein